MTLKKARLKFIISAVSTFLLLLYILFIMGTFRQNALFIEGLACTCPDYEVISGSYKIKSPLLDTLQNVDVSEVFVTGKKNPFLELDYLAYYDYYVIDATIIGTNKVSDGDPSNPLMFVTEWTRINYLTYIILIFLVTTSLLLTIIFLVRLTLLKKNCS